MRMARSIEMIYEELIMAPEWTNQAQPPRAHEPLKIDEQEAIRLAVRAVCDRGANNIKKRQLLRPAFGERRGMFRENQGKPGFDDRGWQFWFTYEVGHGIDDQSLPVFVNDPSGLVEIGMAM